MTLKDGWEPYLCKGGCGYIHRECCDSVLGSEHQSSCAGLGPYIGEPMPSRLTRIARQIAAFRLAAPPEVAPCPA